MRLYGTALMAFNADAPFAVQGLTAALQQSLLSLSLRLMQLGYSLHFCQQQCGYLHRSRYVL